MWAASLIALGYVPAEIEVVNSVTFTASVVLAPTAKGIVFYANLLI